MVLTSVQWFQSNLESDLGVHVPVKFSIYILCASLLCILRVSHITKSSSPHHSDRLQVEDSCLSLKSVHYFFSSCIIWNNKKYYFEILYLKPDLSRASKSKQHFCSNRTIGISSNHLTLSHLATSHYFRNWWLFVYCMPNPHAWCSLLFLKSQLPRYKKDLFILYKVFITVSYSTWLTIGTIDWHIGTLS